MTPDEQLTEAARDLWRAYYAAGWRAAVDAVNKAVPPDPPKPE